MKTLTEINKAIEHIRAQGAAFDQLVQETAGDVLVHFAQHKDTGLVNRLYLALPKGSRKSAMASWMLAYCAVSVNPDKAKAKEQPFVYDKTKETKPEAGALDPWYNHKPEPEVPEVFDLQKAVAALLKKAAAAQRLEHGNYDALVAVAVAAGIPASDVTTKFKAPAKKAEEPAQPAQEGAQPA